MSNFTPENLPQADLSLRLPPEQVRAEMTSVPLESFGDQQALLSTMATQVYADGCVWPLGIHGRPYAALVRCDRAGVLDTDPRISVTAASADLADVIHRASMGERIVLAHAVHGELCAVVGITALTQLTPPLAANETPSARLAANKTPNARLTAHRPPTEHAAQRDLLAAKNKRSARKVHRVETRDGTTVITYTDGTTETTTGPLVIKQDTIGGGIDFDRS